MSLEGKVCVITGGAHGIGEETSKLFEERGANVIIADVNATRGSNIEKESKGRIHFKRVDLIDRNQINDLFNWIDTNYERIDVVINNASRGLRFNVLDITLEDWDTTIALNLTAPFLLSRYAAQKMIRNRTKGKIINIAAVQALSPLDSSFAYSTTKGGLISMTRSLAVDLGRHGILVTAVLPGPVYTIGDSSEPPASLDSISATLIGRMGRKSELAKLLAFLASDDNTFMTGNTIIIDGGRVISRKPDPEEIQNEGKQPH